MGPAPGMRYVKFGSSDMMVSEVCCGTMTFGSFNSEEETFAMLDAAVARGLNFFDTAEMYPVPPNADYVNRTEVLMGKWLQSRVREGKLERNKLYLATKVCGSGLIFPPAAHRSMRGCVAGRADPLGERPPKGLDEAAGPLPEISAEQVMAACKASLTRLQCEYIDLYQVHWPQRYVPAFGKVEYKPERERPDDQPTPESFDKQVLALKALFDAKLIRHWGLSNETSFGIMSFCAACDRHGVPRPVSVQNDVSLLYRFFEQEMAETCRHMNVAGMPYGALAGGTLSGKYDGREGIEPPLKTARHVKFPQFQPRYHAEHALAVSKKYSELATKHGLTPTQLALAWMKSRWWNTSVIIGTTSVAQLEQNVDAFQVELSPEILEAIDEIHKEARHPNIKEA